MFKAVPNVPHVLAAEVSAIHGTVLVILPDDSEWIDLCMIGAPIGGSQVTLTKAAARALGRLLLKAARHIDTKHLPLQELPANV